MLAIALVNVYYIEVERESGQRNRRGRKGIVRKKEKKELAWEIEG